MDTGSKVLAAVERIWEEIQSRYADVPDVVATLAGSESTWGHIAYNRWERSDQTRVHELFISGENLERGAVAVLGTLLHEAAHGINHTQGVQGTSRQGRYHNKRFKKQAEALGLIITHAASIGWSHTEVPEHTAQKWSKELAMLDEAITAHRKQTPITTATGGSNNGHALTCACGRKIRCSAKVYAQAPIICASCNQEFTTSQ